MSGNPHHWAWEERAYFNQCWDLIYLCLTLIFCYVPLPMNPIIAQTFCFVFRITSKRSYRMSFIKKYKHFNKSKDSACGIDMNSYELMNIFTLKKWRSVITWRHNNGVKDVYFTYIAPQDEFLDVIGTKVLRVFLLAIHSHHYNWILLPSLPLSYIKWFETGL